MSVFNNIVKKFKKEKVEKQVAKIIPQKIENQISQFDFEKIEQNELLFKKQKQSFVKMDVRDLDVIYDLNEIYWVFLETQHKDQNGKLISLDVKAVPIRVCADLKKAYDLTCDKTFAMDDVTKGDSLIEMRRDSNDMALFSVKTENSGRRNYGIKGSGEYYNLGEKEPVDSYNAGSPALVKLITKSFEKTDFSSIFKEGSRGFSLKEEAFVTKRDILKINGELEKTYKQERIAQNEKYATTYRRDFT